MPCSHWIAALPPVARDDGFDDIQFSCDPEGGPFGPDPVHRFMSPRVMDDLHALRDLRSGPARTGVRSRPVGKPCHAPLQRTGRSLSRVRSWSAAEQLDLPDLRVERTETGDHYDPAERVVRLTADKFDGRSLTAITVAAHEVGHALQDRDGSAALRA